MRLTLSAKFDGAGAAFLPASAKALAALATNITKKRIKSN